MKTILYRLFQSLLLTGSVGVSAQTIVFEKAYPGPGIDVGRSIAEAPDSSLIVISSTTTNTSGLADIVVTKFSASGTELWSLMNGGFNNDIANAGIVLADGSTVAVGFTGSFTSTPSRDVYLIKVDPQGNLVWTRSYGGSGTDEGMDLKQTADGGFIITGFTASYGAGAEDVWLIKTDSLGVKEWDKTFGSAYDDDARGVALAADGGFILTGGTNGPSGGTQEDLWLIKTDSLGVEEWNRSFGTAGQDWGWDVAVAPDGYVAVGTRNYTLGTSAQFTGEAYFMKVDLQGSLLWDQSIVNSMGSQAICLTPARQGGWYFGGIKWTSGLTSDFWLVKADSNGVLLWEKALGTIPYANMAVDLIQTRNGDVAATGFSGFSPGSNENLHLVRLSDNNVNLPEASLLKAVVVSPNPCHEQLNIYFPQPNGRATLELRNTSGSLICSQRWRGEESLRFNLAEQPAGLYFLMLQTESSREVHKIVKY